MSTSLKPEDFVGALAILEKNDPLHVSGTVKTVDGQKDFLDFSVGGDCEDWIRIPTSIVKRVIHLNNVRCHTHSHPYVVLILKEPVSNDPYGGALSAMLRAIRKKQMLAGAPATSDHASRPDAIVVKKDDDGKNPETRCILIPVIVCWNAFDPAEFEAKYGHPPAAWVQDTRCEVVLLPHCYPA